MREVLVTLLVRADADVVFCDLADFPGYVGRAPSVREVQMDDGGTTSSWEVTFRAGILRWKEEDVFDFHDRCILFRQTDGDMQTFDGSWRVETATSGARIVFAARFDLGVPGLEDFLEPVAARALEENVTELVRSLFGEATLEPPTREALLP